MPSLTEDPIFEEEDSDEIIVQKVALLIHASYNEETPPSKDEQLALLISLRKVLS